MGSTYDVSDSTANSIANVTVGATIAAEGEGPSLVVEAVAGGELQARPGSIPPHVEAASRRNATARLRARCEQLPVTEAQWRRRR